MDAPTPATALQAPEPLLRRVRVTPVVELVVLAVALGVAVVSFLALRNVDDQQQLLPPIAAASLLLANLLPFVALIALAGRRIALRRAAASTVGGEGRLHVRLVVLFTLMASIPIIVTVIAASFMFQSGVQLWGGERPRTAFASTVSLAREGQRVVLERWTGEARAMAADLGRTYPQLPGRSAAVQEYLLQQTYIRNLFQSVIFRVTSDRSVQSLYSYEPPAPDVFSRRVSTQVLSLTGSEAFSNFDTQVLWVVTPIDRARGLFLYVATPNNVDFLRTQDVQTDRVVEEYDALRGRAGVLQSQFNAILFGVALLIIAMATAIALAVANRLIQPVMGLIGATRAVESGDLTARVPAGDRDRDEFGVLASAFNRMTERLFAQTGALESRRALLEAVLSGVSAGVVSVDRDRAVRVLNRSAIELLGVTEPEAQFGQPLAAVSPGLDALLDTRERETIAEVGVDGDMRTFAVRIARSEAGAILTFDDVTQAQLDQRRAAWADVARRVAHEIKNPLTPIQLAAERLQRRYGKTVEPGDTTFARLTETIVRQVGDLRRMVDEFSSFARMPKPVFRAESLVEIARQALFLHEVAHPAVRFTLHHDEPGPQLVCDRRQLGQALTNIVKNAVEAVEARPGDAAQGMVAITVVEEFGRVAITVADNGIGLPPERDRIVEPYMTTRARGTGLGLAIVKKIVEEHLGQMAFSDRPGGGTLVTIIFDPAALAALESGDAGGDGDGAARRAALTRSDSNS